MQVLPIELGARAPNAKDAFALPYQRNDISGTAHRVHMIFDQQEFDIRCEWGEHGVAVLAPISDAVIIVDVLSFSTSVDIAVQQGAIVFPYRWRDDTLKDFATSVNAELADQKRTNSRYSLSPESLMRIKEGTRIVLPSPNGATLSLAAKPTPLRLAPVH